MKRPKRRKFPLRRREEKKTNFRKRFALLKSGKPRLVVKRHLSNITCQVVLYDPKSDKTKVHSSSLELSKYGFNAHAGSIPAAYLAGYLCGKRALEHKVKEAILDTGLQGSTKASGIYAALKGAIDAGMSIPHSGDILPDEGRVKGKHIQDYARMLKKDNPSKYKSLFSGYIKRKLSPEDFSSHFELVLSNINGKKASTQKKTKETS